MIHVLDLPQLDLVHGAQQVPLACTPENPNGVTNQTYVTSWSGRYCDGPQTTLRKNLEYAHRGPDMMNSLIQFDLEAYNEARARQRPIACQPGDIMNTP